MRNRGLCTRQRPSWWLTVYIDTAVTSETIVILRNLRTENDYSQNPKARRIDVATRSCTVALANINCRMKGVNERHDPSRKLPTLPAWRTAAGEITMILSICSSTVGYLWSGRGCESVDCDVVSDDGDSDAWFSHWIQMRSSHRHFCATAIRIHTRGAMLLQGNRAMPV